MEKKDLEEALAKIGWKFGGRYPNERIYDHKGEGKNIRVMNDRIEIEEKLLTCAFFFKGCEVYELGDEGKIDCVGIKANGNEEVFMQFYNHG